MNVFDQFDHKINWEKFSPKQIFKFFSFAKSIPKRYEKLISTNLEQIDSSHLKFVFQVLTKIPSFRLENLFESFPYKSMEFVLQNSMRIDILKIADSFLNSHLIPKEKLFYSLNDSLKNPKTPTEFLAFLALGFNQDSFSEICKKFFSNRLIY
jgi:hypothetical protein